MTELIEAQHLEEMRFIQVTAGKWRTFQNETNENSSSTPRQLSGIKRGIYMQEAPSEYWK